MLFAKEEGLLGFLRKSLSNEEVCTLIMYERLHVISVQVTSDTFQADVLTYGKPHTKLNKDLCPVSYSTCLPCIPLTIAARCPSGCYASFGYLSSEDVH